MLAYIVQLNLTYFNSIKAYSEVFRALFNKDLIIKRRYPLLPTKPKPFKKIFSADIKEYIYQMFKLT